MTETGATEPHVLGDPDALQSIFGNLLSNAIRYTPAGGTVTVATRNDGRHVLVDIRDTGIGMTPEALSRLFERFYRAPEAKRVAPWGLGLGLAICRELCDALGAQISVVSVAGQGTTFTIQFPVTNGDQEDL